MVADLKYFDGIAGPIDRIPADVKELFATAFEIDGTWLVKAASRRQKWIDQAQSLNLYVAAPTGRTLDELYRLAWRTGLKTTYYLRSTVGDPRGEVHPARHRRQAQRRAATGVAPARATPAAVPPLPCVRSTTPTARPASDRPPTAPTPPTPGRDAIDRVGRRTPGRPSTTRR